VADQNAFWPTVNETTPDNLSNLSVQDLQSYYEYFAEAQRDFRDERMVQAAAERMSLLRNEMDRRRHRRQIWLSALAVAVAVIFGVLQCRAHRPPPSPMGFDGRTAPPTTRRAQITPLPTAPASTISPDSPTTSAPLATAQPSQSPP
jgi:hypothetical protein